MSVNVEAENTTAQCTSYPEPVPAEEDNNATTRLTSHTNGQQATSHSGSLSEQGVVSAEVGRVEERRVEEHRVEEHRVEEHRVEGRRVEEHRVEEYGASDADSNVGSHSSVYSHHSTGSLSAVTAAFGKSGASTPCRSRKSSHSGGGSVAGGSGLASLDLVDFDALRFRNNFLQTVEELRMRRSVDVVKEERIEQLVEEKHQLQQKCDDIEHSYEKHLEQCSHQEQEIRKQFSNQLRQLEEDKARHSCHEESRHREVKALKDEIRALQLAKYNVEKRVDEQERQLRVQISSRESILGEMSGVEMKCQVAMSQAASIADQLTPLEVNVRQAVELNRKLQYVNEHQKCILAGYKRDLEVCRQQLVEARVSLADSQAERGEGGERASRKTRTTEQELKMHVELTKQLQTQLCGLREEHQAVLGRLKDAHSLLDKHVETSNRLQESEGVFKEEVGSLRERNERLETDLSALQEEQTSQKEEWSTEKAQWESKTSEVEQRLRNLQGDYSGLQNTHDKLERDRAEQVSELESEMERLAERERGMVEEGRRERERVEGELQGRVRDLEKTLEESKASLQEERKKSSLDKEVQVSTLVLPGSEGSPKNSAVRHEPKTSTGRSEHIMQTETATAHSTKQNQDHLSTKYPPTADTKSPPTTTALQLNQSEVSTDNQTFAAGHATTAVPSPPKSSFLSPEVISESSSASPEHELVASILSTEERLRNTTLKLTSLPRVQLERLQLPLNRGTQNMSDNKSSDHISVSEQQSGPEVKNDRGPESHLVGLNSKDPSPLKRKLDEQQQSPLENTESATESSSAKKQKISTTSEDVPLTCEVSLLHKGRETVLTSTSDALGCNLSQPERAAEKHSLLPLSQPSCSDKKGNKTGNLSLSQQNDYQSSRQGNIPWRVNLPQPPFYMTRRHDVAGKQTSTKSVEREKITTSPMLTAPPRQAGKSGSTGKNTFPPFPPPTHKPTWNLSKSELETIEAAQKQTAQSTTPPAPNESTHVVTAMTPGRSVSTRTSTDLSTMPSKTESFMPEQNVCDLAVCKDARADQSVPDSPGGGDNFAVVFSDGEEEGEGGRDLLSSQMNRKISKVKTFLKMDRLRRTKVPKM